MPAITLLYQCGIANVFDGDHRILQHAFAPCEWFARGLQAAGRKLIVMHWDGAGNAFLFRAQWEDGPGSMFSEAKMFKETD